MKKMIIGVTGSTGGLGRRLSEILNQKGFQLKCLVRSKSKADFWIKWALSLFMGI